VPSLVVLRVSLFLRLLRKISQDNQLTAGCRDHTQEVSRGYEDHHYNDVTCLCAAQDQYFHHGFESSPILNMQLSSHYFHHVKFSLLYVVSITLTQLNPSISNISIKINTFHQSIVIEDRIVMQQQ